MNSARSSSAPLPSEISDASREVPLVRRSRTRFVMDALRTVIGFGAYGFVAIVSKMVCTSAALVMRDERRRKYFCQWTIHCCLAPWEWFMELLGVFHVEFPEIDALRAMRGTIIAPNHVSLIDAPHFLGRMTRLTCVMKGSLLKNPFMSSTSSLAGYLPLDQGTEFIRHGRDALLTGENLLIFPEGTRTIDPPVNEFKKGFALMATLSGAPVQTVFIEVPMLYLGKRWPVSRMPRMPVPIKITLGRQFRARPGQSAREFAVELEGYFREELKAAAEGGIERTRP